MKTPSHLHYSEAHHWIRVEGDNAVIGMTDFAQREFGDIVFVELPKAGMTLSVGESFGSMESVKTVTELYAPLSGKVLEVNGALNDEPQLINASPYDAGWLITIELTDRAELKSLWTAQQYEEVYGE